MKYKKYVGDTQNEAKNKAIAEYGLDCTIIDVRKKKDGGILGFGGREFYEVVIALPEAEPKNVVEHSQPQQSRASAVQPQLREYVRGYEELDPRQVYTGGENYNQQPFNQNVQAAPQRVGTAVQPQSFQQPSVRDEKDEQLLKMLAAMQKQIEMLNTQIRDTVNKSPAQQQIITPLDPVAQRQQSLPVKLQKVYDLMLRSEVSMPIANKLINELQMIPDASKDNWDLLKEHLHSKMFDLFKISKPINVDLVSDIAGKEKMPQLIAFIGTTGVGKTTTLAKIATNLVLKSKKKVVLFTIDTYRVAGTDQIKVYGDIIGVPVEVVFKESDFKQCIAKHKDADIILIDTAGRSQRNNLELLELKKYLYPENFKIEIYLVVCSTVKYRDMIDISKNFSQVNYDKLIFTKTDETTTWGPIMSLAAETGKPISYISTGQNVPDDIMPADSNYIIRQIIGPEEI